MKAQDFRVDNWINVLNPNTNEWKHERIKGKTIKNFQENPTHKLMLNNFKPIELTEEILLKCGFERINHIHGYSFFTLSKSKVNKCHIDIYENKTQYMGYSVSHCKHLHQLQNLYFALTNEELTINL